ncbi:MAG: hypothetical protein ACOY99_07135 [Pseudomonadota bacterium]
MLQTLILILGVAGFAVVLFHFLYASLRPRADAGEGPLTPRDSEDLRKKYKDRPPY